MKKYFYKTLGILFLFTLLAVSSFALAQVHASDFTFKKINIQVENNANVTNNVHTYSNTGGNTTNNNTGGSTTVKTGNAGSETIICNDVNHTVINAGSGQSCPSGASSPTPTPGQGPTPTPTPGSSGGGGGSSGGSSSGSSGGSSSSSSSSGPAQAVLGTSTLAATGTFETTIMNTLFALGTLSLSAGFISLRKK